MSTTPLRRGVRVGTFSTRGHIQRAHVIITHAGTHPGRRDLSNNKLSGTIPEELVSIHNLGIGELRL